MISLRDAYCWRIFFRLFVCLFDALCVRGRACTYKLLQIACVSAVWIRQHNKYRVLTHIHAALVLSASSSTQQTVWTIGPTCKITVFMHNNAQTNDKERNWFNSFLILSICRLTTILKENNSKQYSINQFFCSPQNRCGFKIAELNGDVRRNQRVYVWDCRISLSCLIVWAAMVAYQWTHGFHRLCCQHCQVSGCTSSTPIGITLTITHFAFSISARQASYRTRKQCIQAIWHRHWA